MASESPAGDPRLSPETSERSVLPAVQRPRGGISTATIAMGAVAAGLVLFMALDAHRRSLSAPAVTEQSAEPNGAAAGPPPLYIPPPPPPAPAPVVAPPPPPPLQPSRPVVVRMPAAPPVQVERREEQPVYQPHPVPVQTRPPTGSAIAVDMTQPSANTEQPRNAPPAAPRLSSLIGGTDRARAATLANPSTTVAQGTLISAVLETALDSTRPGMARAMVQRDVPSFDGTRVLIPRGSHLIGDYQSDTLSGQDRAAVIWTRLIRGDGVTIEIGSPAADTVGRGGIKGKVDSHFWQRFGGALLQSTLDVGVNLASRAGNGAVVVLPQSLSGSTTPLVSTQNTTAPPTLKVPQGRSISIFVARDLDFSESNDRRP